MSRTSFTRLMLALAGSMPLALGTAGIYAVLLDYAVELKR
jgi:hypothetical protein